MIDDIEKEIISNIDKIDYLNDQIKEFKKNNMKNQLPNILYKKMKFKVEQLKERNNLLLSLKINT